MKVVILTLILSISVSIGILAQSSFDKTKAFLDGPSFRFGLNYSDFLNSKYSQRKADNIIKPATGFRIGFDYTHFPLFVSLCYFESNFKIADYSWVYPENTNVKHSGAELSVGMFLIHFTSRFLPYAGVGYQSSSLFVGEPILSSANDDSDSKPASSTAASSPVLKFGFQSSIVKRVRFQAEYQRSVLSEGGFKQFNQITFGINIKSSLK